MFPLVDQNKYFINRTVVLSSVIMEFEGRISPSYLASIFGCPSPHSKVLKLLSTTSLCFVIFQVIAME